MAIIALDGAHWYGRRLSTRLGHVRDAVPAKHHRLAEILFVSSRRPPVVAAAGVTTPAPEHVLGCTCRLNICICEELAGARVGCAAAAEGRYQGSKPRCSTDEEHFVLAGFFPVRWTPSLLIHSPSCGRPVELR